MNTEAQNMSEVDVAPLGYAILALSRQNVTMLTALGELIDNGFQHLATRFGFEVGKHCYTATDNGAGTDNPKAIVQIGNHDDQGRRGISMYGIGCKDALLRFGGAQCAVEVESFVRGMRHQLRCDFGHIMTTNKWRARYSSEPQDGRGTTITIRRAAAKFPTGKRLEELLTELGYLYHPALNDAKQIEIRDERGKAHLVKPWRVPELDPATTARASFEVDGRKVHLLIGMIVEGGDHSRTGITYVYRHRVVKTNSNFGAGGFSVRKVCGIVTLGDGWELSKNKDDFARRETALEDAVFRHAKSVLEKAECIGEQLRSTQLLRGVENHINNELFGKPPGDGKPDADEKRSPGDENGTHPKGKGERKRKRATNTKPGNKLLGGKVRKIQVDLQDAPLPGGAYAKCDATGAAVTVTLSLACSSVKETLAGDGNPLALKWAVYSMLAAWAAQNRDTPGQVALFRDGTQFAEYVGHAMQGDVPDLPKRNGSSATRHHAEA